MGGWIGGLSFYLNVFGFRRLPWLSVGFRGFQRLGEKLKAEMLKSESEGTEIAIKIRIKIKRGRASRRLSRVVHA